MYHRPPRIVLGALAFCLLALGAVTKATTDPLTTVRTEIAMIAAPTTNTRPAPPTIDLTEATQQEQLANYAAWVAAAAQPPPEPEPLPAVPATKVAKQAVAPPPDPAPASEAPPEPSGGSAYDAVMQYFPDVFNKAWAVSGCESQHDPNAISPGGGNWGLFQINTVHKKLVQSMGYSWSQILDPFVNADVARALYDGSGGWGPWTCRYAT